MEIKCVWEHNGADSLLYAADLPGAYARGAGREEALLKMRQELPQFLQWTGRELPPEELAPVIVQEKASTLRIADADSDVLFHTQIGVGNRLDGGRRRVKKYLWSFLRTAPAGAGQAVTCSTSGMGLRLK